MATRDSRSKAKEILGNDMTELLYEIAPFMAPRMDVFQTKDAFYISVDIAGALREDLSLKLQGKTLCIEGTIKNSNQDQNVKLITGERFYGSFKREVTLPNDCVLDKLQAEYGRGILMVRVPFW